MNFWVGIAEPDESGWSHYCSERGGTIHLKVSHPGLRAYVFCPLCAGIVVPNGPLHRYEGRDWSEVPREGPRCPHGRPDGRCLDFANSYPEIIADYEYNIQEYAVARLACAYGVAEAVQSWARPCARCRNEFAERHHPTLAVELEHLHEAISLKSREAQTAVREVARAEHLVRDLERWLEGLVFSLGQRREEPIGFVYAISNGEAIKIGWSAHHPAGAGGRLADLQTGSHAELRLVGAVEGTRGTEQHLHARFASHWLRGEWFSPAPEILRHFGASTDA